MVLPGGYSRDFWFVWASTVVSGLGDGVRFIVLPLLAASVTRDPVAVSLVTVAGTLPWVLVGPFTGAMTDRSERRRLLRRVAVFQAVVMTAFTVLTGTGTVAVAILVVATFVMVSADTLALNVSAALVPDLVPKKKLAPANSLLQGGQFVTSDLVGIAIGSVLFGIAPFVPLAVDAATFVLAALLLIPVRPAPDAGRPAATAPGPRPLLADIGEGMRWLARHRLLRVLCVLIALGNFAVTGVMSIAVLYALEELRVGQTTYGLLMVVVAVGGLLGLVIAPILSGRFGLGRTMQLSFLLAPVPFLVAGLTSQPLVAAVAFLFVGAGISMGNVASISIRQIVVPSGLFGRVNSSYRLVAQGLSPVGGLVAGLLADGYGLHAPFLAGFAVSAVTMLVGLPLMTNRAVTAAEAAVTADSPAPRAGD